MSETWIGWSQIDITPSGKVGLIGQFEERISQYIRDSLFATALTVETKGDDGTKEQCIIISTDLIGIYKQFQDELRLRVKQRLADFDVQKLFVCATHIHTGPFLKVNPAVRMSGDTFSYNITDPELMEPAQYTEFLLDQLVELVCDAWEHRKAGGISWGLAYAVVGHNRNIAYNDGTGLMYGDTQCSEFDTLEGPEDHGVELLFTWDQDKALSGIVINIACPSQVVENKDFISADYWGEVRKRIQEKYGRDVKILALCGAAGDQSPRDLVRKCKSAMDMWEEAGIDEIAKRVMLAIADKIDEAGEKIEWSIPFKHIVKEIDLPILEVTREEYIQALKEYNEHKDSEEPDRLKVFPFVGIIRRYLLQQKNQFYQTEVHAIRLGEIAIVTNPFELFVDYGLRMKARSKAQQTFVVQLTGDDGGYLPTEKGFSHKHYSSIAASSLVGPKGGSLLTNHTVSMMNSLWE